jgi:hypothetical protein
MIIQLLGVALISLLTITPTLQQNNIEQLIAPNIEIQTTALADTNVIYTPFNISSIRTNGNWANVVNFNDSHIWIVGDNLYVYGDDATTITSSNIRNGIRSMFAQTYGNHTSDSYSFTVDSSNLATISTYHTYSITNGTNTINGRIYFKDSTLIDTNTVTVNSIVNIPQGLATNVRTALPIINPIINLENSQTHDNFVIGYRLLHNNLTQTIDFNVKGTYNTTLTVFTNYGKEINTNFTLNITDPDTTPPTITSVTGNTTNWTNQNITLTVQATDNVALHSNAYSFDNGVTYSNLNFVTLTTNMIVEIKVKDLSGNIASQQEIVNRIDKTSPAINLAGNWKNTFELGELTSNNDLYNYLSISDGLSGINTALTTISNFNYNQAGVYSNVQVSATDNAGNNYVNTLPTITITLPNDTTGPIITGPTIVNRTEGNITTQSILDLYTFEDSSGVVETRIQDLSNNIITNWNSYVEGSYQLSIYARDTIGNVTLLQITLQVGQAPPPDTTPPTIVGPLLISFEIGTYTTNSEILNLYTFSDNVEILQNQLIGEVNYLEIGDYDVIIRSTDTSNNVSNRNIVIRIRDSITLGNYNPLTDLLSGIFGGLLSMIFTIGTINVLGLRLLDAMGVIILGAVLLFVYKAIKGGS